MINAAGSFMTILLFPCETNKLNWFKKIFLIGYKLGHVMVSNNLNTHAIVGSTQLNFSVPNTGDQLQIDENILKRQSFIAKFRSLNWLPSPAICFNPNVI